MSDWAAKVLAGVPRWTKINGQEIVGPPLLEEHAVLAAIAKLAEGDGLVERLQKLADDMGKHATEEWDESELVNAAIAHIAALTAQVADLEVKLGGALLGQWIDAGMPNDPAEAEAADLRARVAPMNDDDMIRRGDALKIALAYASGEGAALAEYAIRAIPAADARAEALLKRAAQMAYEVWDDPEALSKAILALIPEAKP